MGENSVQNPVSASAAAAALAASKPRYKFSIPETARQWPTDPRIVIFREITVSDEMHAAEIAGGVGFKFAYESLKAAIVEVDGKAITAMAGERETFIEGCSPKVRDLLLKAHNKLHSPDPGDGDAFLASMTVVV